MTNPVADNSDDIPLLTEITFNLIVEASPNVVLLVNERGRVAYLNRQCEILLGYASHELIGQPIETLLPERLRGAHVGLRGGYFAKPSMRMMGAGRELTALHKDGSEIPVEIGLNPLVLVDGTWVIATIIDLTRRRQAEDRFRRVVQAAPNAMVLANSSGVIQLVNDQATKLFGYDEQELLGQSVDMLLPEPLRRQHVGYRTAFVTNPQTRYMGAGRDLLGRRKDGTTIPIEVGLNPIKTDGELMVLASIVDITERKQQQELRTRKEAAEAAYQAKSEVLAIASHDLKNPLASISGLAQIMLEMKKAEGGESSAQDIEFLQSIYEASTHMSDVVKGILANEGLDQQGLQISTEVLDLSTLVADLVRFDQMAAERKGIKAVTEIEPGITLHGDKTRLREAFDNYISNAFKFSSAGTTVTVRLRMLPGKLIEFGVQDQGPGLTDEDKAKLFGKFKKLSARPTGGESSTGLGLSIVKKIIELHQGTVGVDSEYGKGAYFWARLPQQ